jgi:hypothetical protein
MTNIRIKVTVPEIVLDSSFVREKIKQVMRQKTGPDLRKEFKKTVEGWADSPDFSITVYEASNSIITHVFPSGNGTANYTRVNEGAPPHIIRPRHGGMLRFQTGYRAATSPRVIGSRAKNRYGNVISTPIVHHPGFEARAFDETIALDYYETFVEDIQDAIQAATVMRS